MDICIGIISYLPDDEEARGVRISRLNDLIYTCNRIFKLPIIIIAQNWKDSDNINITPNCTVVFRNKLGITVARETLRQYFVKKTDYSNMICLDDDFELTKNEKPARLYLNYIKSNRDKLIEYENYLMNLCVMPRNVAEKFEFDIKISPEDGTGFEDWIYIAMLQRNHPELYKKVKSLNLPAKSRKELVEDKYSTWITSETDKNSIDKASRDIIYGPRPKVKKR